MSSDPLEKALKFIEMLEKKVQLVPMGTPDFPANISSHPIIILTEELIKNADPRVESYTLTEHEYEEKRRWVANHPDFQRLEAVVPGNPLPFKPDPRINLPYRGTLEDMNLLVSIVPDTYLEWKDGKERLYAISVLGGDSVTRMRTPNRQAFILETNSTAAYFGNGIITWFSFFPLRSRDLVAFQWFMPPDMPDSDAMRPPYRLDANKNLAHPTQLKDLDILTDSILEDAYRNGEDYALRERMRRDLTRNAKLVTLFADVHRELYSI